MFNGFELSSGELHRQTGNIRLDMPKFFENMRAPDNVDLKIPIGQRDVSTEAGMEEVNSLLQNKSDGLKRERDVAKELSKEYPTEDGYSTVPEATLRDKDGNVVKDPVTGEARRIDFAVVKDGKVVDSVEVTSKTADKSAQSAKEERIREAGGNYIRDNNGNLVEIPTEVRTRIERRD